MKTAIYNGPASRAGVFSYRDLVQSLVTADETSGANLSGCSLRVSAVHF